MLSISKRRSASNRTPIPSDTREAEHSWLSKTRSRVPLMIQGAGSGCDQQYRSPQRDYRTQYFRARLKIPEIHHMIYNMLYVYLRSCHASRKMGKQPRCSAASGRS
jgi:hypothetical protein